MSENQEQEMKAIDPIVLGMLSRGTHDNEPVTHAVPSGLEPPEMVVREVDVTLAGGVLTFFYSRAWEPRAVTTADFSRYVKEFARGATPAGFVEKPMTMEKPSASKLSIRNRKNRYLVFVLSGNINWQFAQTGPAITVGQGLAHTSFYEGWRVDPAGNAKPEGPKTLDGCRVAYIAAFDGSADGVNSYTFPFNLNVDLFYADGTLTPIVIDPDTRYPGGNTIDGDR